MSNKEPQKLEASRLDFTRQYPNETPVKTFNPFFVIPCIKFIKGGLMTINRKAAMALGLEENEENIEILTNDKGSMLLVRKAYEGISGVLRTFRDKYGNYDIQSRDGIYYIDYFKFLAKKMELSLKDDDRFLSVATSRPYVIGDTEQYAYEIKRFTVHLNKA